MDIEAAIAMLREPPEDGLPETIYDDLHATYSTLSERAGIADGAEAKVAELSAVNEGLAQEVSRLKAHNYDLLMATAGDPGEHAAESQDDDDDDSTSIDDLFSDPDKDEN